MVAIVVELLVTLLKVFKALILGIVFAFVPAPKKSVIGEIVLITGAGSGIGRLMAVELAQLGAKVVCWDIDDRGNAETARQIKESGGKAYTYKCNVGDRTEVYNVAARVKKEVGNVSILINNAGIVSGRDFMQCTDDDIMRTMNVNVHAHFWTVRSFLPSMMAKNHGHIVTIASVAGLIAVRGLTDYCTSKFANVGFTESLALELENDGKDGIHMTTVCPYKISTGMFDGAEGRFKWLMPDLTPEYTAGRIVTAILTDQKILLMGRIEYFLAALKMILPVDAAHALNRFFGGLDFMKSFKGRMKTK